MQVIDLGDALNVLQILSRRHPDQREHSEGYRLRIVLPNIPRRLTYYLPYSVVLWRVDDEEKKTVVIEKPMTPEKVQKQVEKGSLLVTSCCTVNVPKEYIAEIKS